MLFISTAMSKSDLGPRYQYFTGLNGSNLLTVTSSVLANESKGLDSYILFTDRDVIVSVINGLTALGVTTSFVCRKEGPVFVPFDDFFNTFITLTNVTNLEEINGYSDDFSDNTPHGDGEFNNRSDKKKTRNKWFDSSLDDEDQSNSSSDEEVDFTV